MNDPRKKEFFQFFSVGLNSPTTAKRNTTFVSIKKLLNNRRLAHKSALFGHLTSLFCRKRQRNVPKFTTQKQNRFTREPFFTTLQLSSWFASTRQQILFGLPLAQLNGTDLYLVLFCSYDPSLQTIQNLVLQLLD